MPKKKKTKDTTTEFKFDYRYTPKPYFTAPTSNVPSALSSPLNRGPPNQSPVTSSRPSQRPSGGFNTDTWQNQRTQYNYGYNRNFSYARAAQSPNRQAGPAGSSKAATGTGHLSDTTGPLESTDPSLTNSMTSSTSSVASTTTQPSGSASTQQPPDDKTKENIRKMFLEMFKGRVEASVIDMVLQEENWNENQALDVLSQLAPDDNSHLIKTLTTADIAGIHVGAITPDHNLTPTAPTLSYSSSITSLDEYGMEYCRDLTQRNLSQVADALRNGDDINDLDRQRLARSRAATPKALYRNGGGMMTLKNITLGSTESLESNRSHHDAMMGGYATASLTREGTPKKSNFEKTMSLVDISVDDDLGLSLTVPSSITRERRNTSAGPSDLETSRSDPGVESLLIPLEHGDIVLEKGTYDQLDQDQQTTPTNIGSQIPPRDEDNRESSAGPLSHSVSISDYSQAIHSLITQLDSDPTSNSSPELCANSSTPSTLLSSAERKENKGLSLTTSVSSPEALSVSTTDIDGSEIMDKSVSLTNGYTSALKTSTGDDKENTYPYNGLLSSGKAVPTAFESARPKKPRSSPLSPNSQSDEATQALMEVATSGQKVMFLMRGVPGSGKTTLAKRLIEDTRGNIFSGDDFFMNSKGEYIWDSNQLGEAHAWNQNRVRKAAEDGITPIVVDNTHTQAWEMEPCVKTCLQHGYRPVLAEPATSWRYKAKDLAKKTTHGVPYPKIKLMLERFEHTVTVEQIINKIIRREPSLQPMAEQIRVRSAASGAKLSRKKPASKTIKRNKQHDTVEKFKDKKVDELTQQVNSSRPSPPRQGHTISTSEDDDNQGETEIMYPSSSVGNGALRRKATIKVLNCDRPPAVKVPQVKSNESLIVAVQNGGDVRGTSKTKQSVDKKDVTETGTVSQTVTTVGNIKVTEKKADTQLSVAASDNHVNENIEQVKSENSEPEETRVKIEPIKLETIKVTPILASHPTTSDKPAYHSESSSDSAIGNSPDDSVDQSPTSPQLADQLAASSSCPIDQSPAFTLSICDPKVMSQSDSGIECGSKNINVVGSATLPRPSSNRAGTDTMMSQSASQSLKKPKKSSSSTRRSKSTNLLDKDLKDKWLSNDWAVPPYPITSSPDATVDPPPPYSEIDNEPGATVKPALAADNSFVKKKETGTLTEPSDYAMAYKAMQHNHQLPEGWILLTARSREPFHPPQDAIPYKSAVLTHEKGTNITEDDKPDLPYVDRSADADTAPLTSHREQQIQHLSSCFPQLIEGQLSEFLDLCQGDETWATNLLLDSNKLNLPKPKRSLNSRVLTIPDNIRSRKSSLSKSALVRKLNKAIVPVTSCLRGQESQASLLPASSPETMSINLTVSQARDLHAVFGQSMELPSIDGEELSITVPKWLARRIHRCMLTSLTHTDDASINTTGHKTITALPSTPKRPPRHKRKHIQSKPHVAGAAAYQPTNQSNYKPAVTTNDVTDGVTSHVTQSGSSVGGHVTQSGSSVSEDDWRTDAEVWQREEALQKADEELARRLQSEDLLQVIRETSPGVSPARHPHSTTTSTSSMTLITDEQYARSLAQQDIKSSMSQPDLSAQLKRQKLYGLYPQADKTFLDEIYSSCGYNLEPTLQFLSQERGPPNLSSAASRSALSTPDRPNTNSGKGTSVNSRETTPNKEIRSQATAADNDDDQWYDVEDVASVIDNPSYQDYRAEANLHLQKRTECLQKASVARRKGMGDVSTYYTRLAEHHRVKSKEADFSAASRIFEDKNRYRDNNEVDLHGLHSHESVALLEQVIQLKRTEGKMKYINVITGRGNRSRGGVAKVKQAVVSYLDNQRISYRVENGGGMIRVVL